MKKSALLSVLFIGVSQIAMAQYVESYFAERPENYCRPSDPEFSAWFFQQTREIPQIHKILGPVRDQRTTSQCYAMAAADMITAHTKVRVSGEQVAYLYYQKSFTGFFQRVFGSNKAGFIASAIEATEGQSMCEERNNGILHQNPSPEKGLQFCTNPKLTIGNYSVKGQPTNGLGMGHQLFSQMDEILNSGKIVGVSYRAQDIFPGFDISAFNTFANHASTVVARHWNAQTNACEYVIRNSSGESCASSFATCFRGYYSVPEKLIDKALQNIDYIR